MIIMTDCNWVWRTLSTCELYLVWNNHIKRLLICKTDLLLQLDFLVDMANWNQQGKKDYKSQVKEPTKSILPPAKMAANLQWKKKQLTYILVFGPAKLNLSGDSSTKPIPLSKNQSDKSFSQISRNF